MALTDSQLQTFATDLQNNTDPTVTQALSDGNNVIIRDWYNDLPVSAPSPGIPEKQ